MKKEKTILITGAALRLGKYIALSLADAGWNVVIHYHRSQTQAQELAKQIEKKKRRAYLVKADLSNAAATAAVIPYLTKKGILLDGLINNAAVFEKDNLASLTQESWHLHMQANLFAPLQLIRDFAAQYTGKDRSIINITDGMWGWSVSPTFLSYSLSKLGLTQATQLLAKELAPRIRINAVAPGPTLEGKQDDKDTFTKLKKLIPLHSLSTPGQLCDAITYLLNAPCVTGQIIALSGGLHTSSFLPL